MDAVAARARFIAEAEPPVVPLEAFDQAVQRLGVLGISPIKRTSPPRPVSAIATDVILLCTSNPTYVVGSMRPVSYA
jgi:hypothetical protein